MSKFVNCTDHIIRFNDGTVIEPSGSVSRTSPEFELIGEVNSIPEYRQRYGSTIGLPRPEKGTIYIVSQSSLKAAKQFGRKDCRAPSTMHPETVRDEDGKVISVSGLIK